MSDTLITHPEIVRPDFTEKEAEAHTELLVNHSNATRWLLLEAFERKAHKALKYSSFEEYCSERLQMTVEKSNLSNLVRWAEVERNILGAKSYTTVQLPSTSPSTSSDLKLPRITALELAKLPTPELQRSAWNEIETVRHMGTHVPSDVHRNLKHIVKQLLAGEPASVLPVETPAAPSQDTPVSAQNTETVQTPTEVRSTPSAPVVEPPKRTPAVVSSFTPTADTFADDTDMSEVKEPIIPDWEEWQIVLDTMAAMVTNKEIEPMARIRKQTACTLRDMVTWLEA